MRIIGGQHRGRRLIAPPDRLIRPTADRAREALFAALEHGDPPLFGARFLDLFSGTGAIGLEAWSRGAAEVLMIDRDARLAMVNYRAFGAPAAVQVVQANAVALPSPKHAFDIVFLDPPYQTDLGTQALDGLRHGWLASGARVVLEQDAKARPSWPPGYVVERDRRYGTARFYFLRLPETIQDSSARA